MTVTNDTMYMLALTTMIWQGVTAIAATVGLTIVWLNLRRMDLALQTQIEHLREVKAAVEGVHKATNSLVSKVVQSTEAEALLRGGIEEREKAEARDREKYLGD